MWTNLNALILSLYSRVSLAKEALILSLHTRAQLAREEGQTAVEYAMVIGLVSVVIVTALVLFKGKLETFVKGIEI